MSISNNNTSTEAADNISVCGSSKSNNDVREMNDMLKNVNFADDKDEDIISICANCGKEGSNITNTCNKCKLVKYCNAACKKKHRHKHRKDCEEHVRLAAEQAAKLHDEQLFKQSPSPYGDCPICFLRIPTLSTGWRYQTCCGKVICSGCVYAPRYDNQGNKVDNKKCPFCRAPTPCGDEELNEREKKRMQADDSIAIYNIGMYHQNGRYGFPQDYNKALELYHRAAKLGHSIAYCNIGYLYNNGLGVEIDMKKANHFYELAAIGGSVVARFNLCVNERNEGNFERALKHQMIAARDGYADSLKKIQDLYKKGDVTKDDYMKALQSYQAYLGEIKSSNRDEAAAYDIEMFRYY